MTNSYSGNISKLRFNGNDYLLRDNQIHAEISKSIQSIADFASEISNKLSSFSSFVSTTSNFMNNSYIRAVVDDPEKQEYAINIFIDKS